MGKIFVLIFGILFLLIGGIYLFLFYAYPKTPTTTAVHYFIDSFTNPHLKLDKQVIGFLPYWDTDDIPSIELNSLSEVNYFSLSPNGDGEIIKVTGNETHPGWREWDTQEMKDFITQAHIIGTDVSLTILSHDADVIESILASEQAQETLIDELIDQVKTRQLDAINIDFEYLGNPPAGYQGKFILFSHKLSRAFTEQVPDATLSISVMPRDARETDGLLNSKQLQPFYDRFIVMSYDYYGSNADIAGPVAPMKGFKEEKYFFDVETTYADYKKIIPTKKLIMGVPYYGWDRAVEAGTKINSLTFAADDPNNYAAVISYSRMRESENLTECKWDDIAQERWCWYTDPQTNIDHQVWVADNKSIGIRFDYANKQDFAGIAIWALGYDKGYNDLWEMIRHKFTH